MYDLSHLLAIGASAPLESVFMIDSTTHRASPGAALPFDLGALGGSPAHRFRLHDPRLAGAVVCNAAHDPEAVPHNADSTADGNLLRTVIASARRARGRAEAWATEGERARLLPILPSLRDEAIWTTFAATWDDAILPRHLIPFVRRRGWARAAVVLHGAMMNVVQEVDRGDAVTAPEAAEWTMVGLIRGEDDLVVHGFRAESHRPGRTVCACLAEGPLDVAIYPLD